ncbi:ABC transporter permease subunit [Yimella sp. cx-51]|uniref:ABC transporter permease subunit n=1 Tax=Yimella sp. cx-51 TaxID=2770551 RepID=UPI00165DFB73|nr:ABC transporter permease subunit [Yimella sp. cx-51]MBC9955802.1 ABC transporter permease subunit [Yimella sp. cx-51]QTH37645.1 ABC transporter permease subunit [Yimella sp. cx-51]
MSAEPSTKQAPATTRDRANPIALLKWPFIAAAMGALFYIAMKLADKGYTLAVAATAFVALLVLAVYGTRKAVPMKYLLPGLLLLLGLQVWPIVYTGATAFTNYGQGHLASKEDATAQNLAYSVQQVPGSPNYKLSVAVPEGQPVESGPLTFLLTDEKGKTFVGTEDGLKDLDPAKATISDTGFNKGKITAAEGYRILNLGEANKRKDLQAFAVPTATGGIKASGIAQAYEGKPSLVWDKKSDTIKDSKTGQVYVAKDARWVPQNGQGSPLPVGWKENVGLQNFKDIFTNDTLRSGFLKVFAWNIAFPLLSVLTTFVLGMLLALLLNDSRIKGRGIYRSLLILPYAIPVFVSALVWASMFNQDFGLINGMTGLNIDWLGDPWAARAAILLTNLWLGFPYMFVVCTGALQSIPNDVLEAAKIDGAGPIRTLRSVIMPLLLVAVGPLLIASFAFNFNNFGLIYLLTGGGPFTGGNSTVGSTDLLITMSYRLAIEGTSPNFGLASAIAVIIFIIVGLLSFPGFLKTKALEEVN